MTQYQLEILGIRYEVDVINKHFVRFRFFLFKIQ